MKKHYLPSTFYGRKVWLSNFAVKLHEHATELGITPAILTFADDAAAFAALLVETDFAIKSNSAEWTDYKRTHLKGKLDAQVSNFPTLLEITPPATPPDKAIVPKIIRLVNNIKNHDNYKESIGKDMKIVAPSTAVPDSSIWQPTFRVKINANRVVIKWMKAFASALDLYVDRGDGEGFKLLATSISTTIEDVIQLASGSTPQSWTYKCIYRLGDRQTGDRQVGLFSLPVTILVAPVI